MGRLYIYCINICILYIYNPIYHHILFATRILPKLPLEPYFGTQLKTHAALFGEQLGSGHIPTHHVQETSPSFSDEIYHDTIVVSVAFYIYLNSVIGTSSISKPKTFWYFLSPNSNRVTGVNYTTNPSNALLWGKSLKNTIHSHCLRPPTWITEWPLSNTHHSIHLTYSRLEITIPRLA